MLERWGVTLAQTPRDTGIPALWRLQTMKERGPLFSLFDHAGKPTPIPFSYRPLLALALTS